MLASCSICVIGLQLWFLPLATAGSILVWAACAKAAALTSAATRSLVPTLARVAIPLELVIGSWALSAQQPVLSAAAVMAIASVFVVYIFGQLRQPLPPPCACFGTASSAPLSRRSVVRPAALSALGVVALVSTAWGDGSDLVIGDWFGTTLVGAVLAGALIQFSIAFERARTS
jgi:hypothetical protein